MIMDGYIYSLKKETKTSKNWQCTNRKCNGKLTTSLDGKVILHADTRHNHASDESKIQTHLLRQACKRKAEEEISERPRKLIIREAGKLKTDKVSLSGVQSSRRAIWIQRRKAHPKLPSTRQEALIAASQMTTRDNALIEVDYERQIVGIFDTMAIQLTKDVEDFFGDGIFKSCPKQFHQIYTVITHANGSYVPLAFFLLPDKKEKTYEAMFQHFRRVFERLNGGNLENKTIHLDFGKTAHEVVKHVLPTFALRGCLFHLKQSWWRKIQELGLSAEYKDGESAVGRFLKSTFGLPFLDFLEVCDCFAFDVICEAPEDDAVSRYIEYLTRMYITSTSSFPPHLWASSDVNQKRTTNGCESFHKHLNSLFYTAHPSVFELTDRLQEIMSESKFKLQSTANLRTSKAKDVKKRE